VEAGKLKSSIRYQVNSIKEEHSEIQNAENGNRTRFLLARWSIFAILIAIYTPAAQGADAKKEPSPRPAAADASIIPEMQAGKWKLRVTKEGGSAKDSEMCGDPIDGFSREVQDYAASTKWGCTMTTNASGPRSARVVYDCPSDRSPDGRAVSKGRSELSLVSASPQAFRIEMKSTVYPGYVMEGTRIGNCELR